MNVIRRSLEFTVNNVDLYRRDQRVHHAALQMRKRIRFLLTEADPDTRQSIKDTATYHEAIAIYHYINGNDHTQIGITQRRVSEVSLKRASDRPDWNEHLDLLHKRGREAVDRIQNFR